MTISAILPCYNHGRLLLKKIRELESQVRPPDEIVIVDDASTDNTWETMQSLRSSVPLKLLRNAENCQVPETENRGFQESRGTHVFFTACDDDVLSSTLVESAESAFRRNPSAGFWCAASVIANLDVGVGQVVGTMFDVKRFVDPDTFRGLLRRGRYCGQGQTMVWRREAFTPYVREHRWMHDCLPPLRAALRHGFLFDPQVAARLNVRSGTYSSNGMKTVTHRKALAAVVASVLREPDLVEVLRGSPFLGQFGLPVLPFVRGGPLASRRLTQAALLTSIRRLAVRHVPRLLARLLVPDLPDDLVPRVLPRHDQSL